MESLDFSETIQGSSRSPDQRLAREAGFVWTLLPRHGRRPARLLGRELMRADNRDAAGAGHLRCWSEIRIYELASRGFAVSVRHIHSDDDRVRYQDVWQAEDATTVIAMLRNHDIGASMLSETVSSDLERPGAAWQSLVGAIFGRDVKP
jgi:hypothetical protein